jgi:glycosyltransferase involved in cell wall biosynthesis
MKKLIQVVGPSFTNYSLARVNRGLALALAAVVNDYEVKVVSDSRYAERDPSSQDWGNYPEVAKLQQSEIDPAGIVIFNNFPKDPNGDYGIKQIDAALKLVYIAWEESQFPEKWIAEFNQYAHAVIASSSFVRDILTRCGLSIPVFVVLNAIDDKIMQRNVSAKFPLQSKKEFKFLHISSGYPRKGTDILIKAFSEEFNASDNVSLIIKGFPHPLNQAPRWVEEATSRPNSPEIELVNRDISDQDLAALFNSVDAGVYPTRAEGFGLPIAESMLQGLPTIATNYGAHLDFFNETNGYPIDFHLVPAVESQLANSGGKWAEPSTADLKRLMREVYEQRGSDAMQAKLEQAKQAAIKLTWQRSARSFLQVIEQLNSIANLKQIKRVIIGERNNKSGLADYVSYLHSKIDNVFAETLYLANSDVPDLVSSDSVNIQRTWTTGELEFTNTIEAIKQYQPSIVHIEYHSGNYKPQALTKLITQLLPLNIPVVLTVHSASLSTADIRPFAATIKQIAKVLVHSRIEELRLKTAGIDNAEFFVHGNALPLAVDKLKLKKYLAIEAAHPVIATHGLLTDKKGIDSLIIAAAELKQTQPNLLLILANAVSSNNISSQSHYLQYQQLVKDRGLENNTLFITDFLKPEQITALLSISDLNVLAYNDNGEGASGAVQKLIAANQPMILTDIPAFEQVSGLALLIESNQPEQISKGISKLLADKTEQQRQTKARADYLAQHNWYTKSMELLQIYTQVL